MFGTLGTVFALLGKAFGTFLANPWVIVPLALLFVAMALSMFGAFELALPTGLQQRLSQVGGRGFAGAFLMGLVGGLIAAPCTGPPLAGSWPTSPPPATRSRASCCWPPTPPASACRSG